MPKIAKTMEEGIEKFAFTKKAIIPAAIKNKTPNINNSFFNIFII